MELEERYGGPKVIEGILILGTFLIAYYRTKLFLQSGDSQS